MGAQRLRKVRIAEIFARKVLLEAILGAGFGGVGALEFLPGKFRGKSIPKSTPKSTPKSMDNLWQNVWLNVWKIYGKIYGRFYGNPTTHLGGEIPEIGRNRDG